MFIVKWYLCIINFFLPKLLETCKKIFTKITKTVTELMIILSAKLATYKTYTKVTFIEFFMLESVQKDVEHKWLM